MVGMTTRMWLQDLLYGSLPEEGCLYSSVCLQSSKKEDNLEEFVNTSPGKGVPYDLFKSLLLTSLPQGETDRRAMSQMTRDTLALVHQLWLLRS